MQRFDEIRRLEEQIKTEASTNDSEKKGILVSSQAEIK